MYIRTLHLLYGTPPITSEYDQCTVPTGGAYFLKQASRAKVFDKSGPLASRLVGRAWVTVNAMLTHVTTTK